LDDGYSALFIPWLRHEAAYWSLSVSQVEQLLAFCLAKLEVVHRAHLAALEVEAKVESQSMEITEPSRENLGLDLIGFKKDVDENAAEEATNPITPILTPILTLIQTLTPIGGPFPQIKNTQRGQCKQFQ